MRVQLSVYRLCTVLSINQSLENSATGHAAISVEARRPEDGSVVKINAKSEPHADFEDLNREWWELESFHGSVYSVGELREAVGVISSLRNGFGAEAEIVNSEDAVDFGEEGG